MFYSEWFHPSKNSEVDQSSLSDKSNRKVWWLGECGHEWEARVSSFTAGKKSCPVCANRLLLPGFNDLASKHPELVVQWHPSKNEGLTPEGVLAGSRKKFWWVCGKGHEREATIQSMLNAKGNCLLCVNSVSVRFPDVAAQWHPTKNGGLSPDEISYSSSRKVWWVCGKGHEWEAIVSNRARSKNASGCPFCTGKRVEPGVNDLATVHPDVASLWHPVLNEGNPGELSPSSKKVVYWLHSSCGHSYPMAVHLKVKAKNCQVCTNRVIVPGVNDLATLRPEIAKEWHPTKNGELTAEQVSIGKPLRVWWLCSKGHEWETSINDRVGYKTQCPVCVGKILLPGFNDLATTNPGVLDFWNYSKNELQPTQVTAGSEARVSWKCDKGHEWEATVYSLTKMKTRCPVCAKKAVWTGENDLLTLNPELASQWHPTKNGKLAPSEVAAFSSLKVWWQCGKGHEWEASVSGRHQGRDCAQCNSGEKASKAEKTISSYIESFGLAVIRHGRTILKGQELDVYVPEKNLAVEFNGVYWHTESRGKHRTYHYDKWKACKEQGIQLIQVWEDDWNRNPELIKRMLAHKLGVSQERKVFARKTAGVPVTKTEAEVFLTENHIQGFAAGSYYLGLRDNEKDELVAVLVLKKEPGTEGRTLNIIRYATNCNVVGGFTKLLKYAEKTYVPDKFITFSDHCVSDGGLYKSNGFVADVELRPDYMYLINKERKHKFGYRLKKFRDDPNLLWGDGLTERELATLNNIPRIWDAGKTRWVKNTGNITSEGY